MKNLKIGLTVPKKSNNSLWSNGIVFNILFFAKTLQQSSNNYEIFLVVGDDYTADTEIPEHIKKFNFKTVEEGLETLDVLFIIGSQLKKEETVKFKSRKNTILIGYHCGNSYILNLEDVLFKENTNKSYFYENNLDEVWYVPQQHENNYGLYKTLYRTNATAIPFVWSPEYLQKSLDGINIQSANKKYNKDCSYNPNKNKKTIAVLEPNINLIKLCTIPALITEQCYRTNAHKIEELILTNAIEIVKERHFLSMMAACNLYKDKKIKADARYQTAYVVSQYADIVISHQLCNPLNYLYLDIAYMGYPILHNAWMCEDLGYYYKDSDVIEGAKQLEYILNNHDNNIEEYNNRNKKVIARYLANNENVVKTYDILLENLLEGKKNTGLLYNHKTNLLENLK